MGGRHLLAQPSLSPRGPIRPITSPGGSGNPSGTPVLSETTRNHSDVRIRPFLHLDWLSGAAEPPPRSFIRSKRGRQESAVLHLFFSSASDPFSRIRHGEREPWSFIGGGEGRR